MVQCGAACDEATACTGFEFASSSPGSPEHDQWREPLMVPMASCYVYYNGACNAADANYTSSHKSVSFGCPRLRTFAKCPAGENTCEHLVDYLKQLSRSRRPFEAGEACQLGVLPQPGVGVMH